MHTGWAGHGARPTEAREKDFFFEKKKQKTFDFLRVRSFLLLFFKKEVFFFCLTRLSTSLPSLPPPDALASR
jgi:hypothetical protein